MLLHLRVLIEGREFEVDTFTKEGRQFDSPRTPALADTQLGPCFGAQSLSWSSDMFPVVVSGAPSLRNLSEKKNGARTPIKMGERAKLRHSGDFSPGLPEL